MSKQSTLTVTSPMYFDSESKGEASSAASASEMGSNENLLKTRATTNKRKRIDDSISRKEITNIIESLRLEQEDRFDKLLSTIQNGILAHTEQNNDIKTSIEFLSQKYDEVLLKINRLEEEKSADRVRIQQLENKIEALERRDRSTAVELRNIPKTGSESKTDLINLVQKIGSALNVPVQISDIRDVYRINTKLESNKPIIAELTTVLLKEQFLAGIKNYNKQHNNKFGTTTIQLQGPQRPIYISENLTSKTKRLFYMAREFAKHRGYLFCWTTRGVIYLRKTEGSPPVKVNSEEDLNKMSSE